MDNITKTKAGNKLHRSSAGSVVSHCGHRTPVVFKVHQVQVAHLGILCGHCFGFGLHIGAAVGLFVFHAARVH